MGAGKRAVQVFDRLSKLKDMETGKGSIWQGERGVYVIRHVNKGQRGSPVARVMLNSRYLTGLFPTRDSKVFSADVKSGERRIYLLFHLMREGQMQIEFRKGAREWSEEKS